MPSIPDDDGLGLKTRLRAELVAANPWMLLHPSLNSTGTDTLRFSSNNPNSQNIPKQEIEEAEREEGRTLRYVFGPLPGREWWSIDYSNLELAIPAYEAGELAMIELFENPDQPPYYGSNHLLNFHTVYPDIWDSILAEVGLEKVGPECKKRFVATYYQWCKNGGFSIQYGAQKRTADRSFHKAGAFELIRDRFSRIHGPGGLNAQMIRHANEHGYVYTMADKTVNPKHGYPLYCTRAASGRVLPTVPLSYHIQGTAMWCTCKAMPRCHDYLERINHKPGNRRQYYITLQVHDEMVFDFPRLAPLGHAEPWRANLNHARNLARLMRQSGDDIGIPLRVSVKYHANNWSEELSVAV